MLVITSGPIKPLTEVERAFAAAMRGEIEVDGERWVDAHFAARLCGWRAAQQVWDMAIEDGWRSVRHRPRLFGRRTQRILYFAKADVRCTADRLKSKRDSARGAE